MSLSTFLKERLLSAPRLADDEESNCPISKKLLMQSYNSRNRETRGLKMMQVRQPYRSILILTVLLSACKGNPPRSPKNFPTLMPRFAPMSRWRIPKFAQVPVRSFQPLPRLGRILRCRSWEGMENGCSLSRRGATGRVTLKQLQ